MHEVIDTPEKVETRASPEAKATPASSKPTMPPRELFSDSLLQTSGKQRNRRMSATVLSFLFNCLFVSIVIVIPLLFTDALPRQQLITFLSAPPPPPPPPPAPAVPEAATRVVKVASDIMNGQLRTPSAIPQKVQMIKEDEAPPPLASASGVVGGVPGGIPGGQLGGVIDGIVSSTSNLAALPKPAPLVVPVQRLRVSSGVSTGLLTYRTDPDYPTLAKQAHIQGAVVLDAIIGKDGNVKSLQLMSGHPMLAPAAITAVKQWRYKPYLLNGDPIEVETTITVTFRLYG